MSPPDDTRLDNPVHAALSGAQARFAQVCGRALRYPADVAPFLALPSKPSREDWRDAAELVAPGTRAAIVHTGADVPETWKTLREFEVVQMIGEHVNGFDEPEAISLTAADVPEMLELARLTDPGPFLARTIELGDYLGIRRGGQLVAMGGERLHLIGRTCDRGVRRLRVPIHARGVSRDRARRDMAPTTRSACWRCWPDERDQRAPGQHRADRAARNDRRVRGLPCDRRGMGPPAHVPELRPDRLRRQLRTPPCLVIRTQRGTPGRAFGGAR